MVSPGSHWGLIKNQWVLTKFAIALAIPTFAGVKENFWVRELTEKTAANPAVELTQDHAAARSSHPPTSWHG